MIKSIIEKVMIKEFSKYIHGIEYNKLTVEVFGGFFGIQNISLNHDFFNKLQTPLNITYSHIGKLSIQAPLTKLSSVPVSCTIEDVYVIAEHKKNAKKISEISKEELLRKYIKETFDVLVDKIKDSKKQDGMLDKLGKKILDNLKLQIKNIHIRFQQSNQQHTYSFGISLKSLTFGTTDKNWNSIYIQRQGEKQEGPIFKCLTIQNFKLYWQSISKEKQKQYLFLRFQTNNQRIQGMRKFVTNDFDSIFNLNSIIKMKINPNSFTNQPLFQIQVDLQPIQIKFSKQKMVQILDFTTSCIKYNEVMLKTLLDKALKKLTHEQEKKYKPICTNFVINTLDKQADKKKDPNLAKQFKDLFDNIAIEHLYELSMPEIKQKIQQHRQKEIKKQKKSWFSSAQVQLTSQQKKEVEKLLNELIEDSVAKGRPQQSILLKLMFELKGLSFHFYDDSKDSKLRTIELSIQNVTCVLEKSQNKSYFSIESKIKRITADLTLEEDKQLKKIHLMENICEGENEYLIEFIYRQSVKLGKITIINYFSDLSLRKTLLTYKKEYWKMFNSFFSLPEINQQVQNEAMGKLQLLKKESSEDEGEQIQIEKHYNINLNLNSPTFILPLRPQAYWYLDLGKIAMKSETEEKKFIYPFKLSELNMRYISGQKQIDHTQSLLKSKQFFPIIKNIYVQVNMITKMQSSIVEFQILLDKIELNATRQQFINLMNIKKFIIGEEKDQIQVHKEQVKNKEQLVKKKRLDGKILKRNKYFYNWIQFYCLFSNNSLMLYSSEKDLIPQSIIALRGVRMHKKLQQNEYILEISSNNESFYLQFKDRATIQLWQSEIVKNLQELKDFHSLILEGNQEQHKPKRKKKQDLVSIHLRMNQVNWNYLNEKGQQFLKISLKKIYFVAAQKEQKVETQFKIQDIQIVDKVFDYKNPKYQHLFLASQLVLKTSKTKQSVTKISPTSILIKIKSFDINWKPDTLLLIIESVKQFLQIKPTAINKDITRRQIIESIKNDEEFKSKIEKYNALSKESIKQKRASYLQINEKDDQIYAKFSIQVENLNVNFIHRQSHMPMFMLTSQKLITNITTGKVQKEIQGSIYSLELYQITGYPQQSYDINVDYEPYCLINKKQSHKEKRFTQFKYTSYEADQIANKERVDSFLSICFAPLTLNYIQQVTFRIIDYFMVQIVLLLNHSEVITVNQDILKQIISNNPINNEKPKNFLENQFQIVIKRFFDPFFMDWSFEFESPEIIIKPIKNNKNYFSLNLENIKVNNSSIRKDRRFSNVKYEFSDNIYEEVINISGSNIIMNSIHQDIVTKLVSKPFNLALEVNRLLFQDEINEITPQITGYDRSFKIENNISAIQIAEISKFVYENLLRLPNFNLNYEDGNSQLFIHNYRITKILLPKPIKYRLKIEGISLLAKHSLDQIKDIQLKLWSITIREFQLQMSRDEKLSMILEINFSEAKASIYEYPDFADLSTFNVKELARIHNIKNSKNYAVIKMPNTGIIDIQTCLESSQLNLNFGILPLIADWVQPDDSVFAITNKQDRLIKFMIRLPRVVVNLQQKNMFGQCMKMVGELIIQVTRKNGESENYLRSGYLKKEIHPNYIEQLNQFMNLRVTLGLQFFTRLNNKDRKILEKTDIQVKQEYYYKIRNDEFRKTVRRRVFVSELKGSMAVDDIILFKSVAKSKDQGALYQKQFRQILKQAFMKSEKDLEKSIYKDLLIQEKMLQEFVFNVQTIKFYLVYKEKADYMPILRIGTNKISLIEFVNKTNQVYNGQFDLQVFYFNDQIFRWEPFVENTKMKLTLTNNLLQTNKYVDAQISNEIYINISSQIAVSVKKALKAIQKKIQQYNEGNYIPQEGQQYQSRYVIRNQIGYPLEIYDETHKSQFFMMTGQSINYVTKKLQGNFFEQNEIKEVFSFLIHHPSYELLQVTNISLESQKSFDIELYDAKGRKLPDHCRIYLQNRIDGWKKIMTIRSKKYISDYSGNNLVKKYYPFDNDSAIIFTEGVHKGIKANFYTMMKTQRFQYNGLEGNLVIRKAALVYNYTVIPLNVNENIVVPGEFVGINGPLTIQGKPYKQSFLKVSFNEFKQEYYIYSISYIINYTALTFLFDTQYQIKLYNYEFKENGKTARVFLLPDINFEFKVKYSKTSSQVKLNGKLSRQQFQITDDNAQYMYACSGRLESFCTNNIKQFKKIIQITNAYQFCNDTTEILLIRQVDTIEKEKDIVKPGQNIVFNWANKFLRQLLLITIVDEKQQWHYASPLPIVKNIDTFVIRNKRDPSIKKIYCLELQETNNLNFIHILNSQTKYEISNELSNVKITLYQTAVFQVKDTDFIPKNVDPTVYTYDLPPKTKKYFGFQLPIHSHDLTIHFQSTTNPQQAQVFAIDDIEKNVIEKNLQLFKSKQKASIKLQFNRKNKKLKFYVKRKEIFKKQQQQLQAKIKIKAIYVSLIGIHEYIRKQLINACFGTINLHLISNNQYTEQCLQIQNIRIENTVKPQPYFITLFNQEQDESKLALKFIIKKSRFNPNLIYNIAFSMRKSIITVTSQELQIIQQNVNNIMEKVNAKSDTNFFINFDDLFTPAKLVNHSKLYFVDAQLHPLKFILTYKHVNNWGGALLKALSINNCKMTVNGKKISNFASHDLLDFFAIMGKYFKQELQNQIFSMIGSLGLLGSPLNLASKIGCGLQNLIQLPADGFQDEGFLGVGKGLALGTGSLISNTVQGAFGSVESITGAIGQGISGLASYDKNFQKNRQSIKNQRVEHVGQGLVSGGRSIFNGIFTGITGLVTEPIKGAEKQGLGGFFKGGFKGLTGLIVKPVSGVIDATSKTAQGIKNTTKVFSKQAKQSKTRRYNPRPFYGYYREIRPYDTKLAQWNKEMGLYSTKYGNLSWVNLLPMKNGELVLLSYEYLLIIDKKQFDVRASYESSSILSITVQNQKFVLIAKNSQEQKQKVHLQPKEYLKFNLQIFKVFNHFNKNYEIGVDRRSTIK